MTKAPLPSNEPERLAALRRYGILDTLPEAVFDDLTKLAAHICSTPIALISLVDEHRQWFKSRTGTDLTETPRESSICAHAILGTDVFVVEDAAGDNRFKDYPYVTGELKLRFYAGMPLRTPDGHNIGTLCLIDRKPHPLPPEQKEALRILAHQVISQMELRRHLVDLERSFMEQREMRDALRATESFYEALVESLPQNILRKDRAGRFTFANQKFCAMLGHSLDEIIGKTDRDFYPPHLADKYHRDDLRVMASREPVDTVEANQTADGEKIFVHGIKTPLYDAGGNVIGIQGIFWDVTERKKTEEALAYERDLLRALLDHIPDRVYFKDVASRFLRISKSMATRLGLDDPAEVIGKTDADFYPRHLAQEFFNDEQRIILTGQPLINKQEKLVDVDGRESWASVTKVPIYNKAGGVTGLIGISRDISKLKEAEAALEQARDTALETARVKSEFLANMSHEIRTPMNAITGMTGLLLDTPLDEEQREFTETIRASTDNLLGIISDILDFSKIEAGKLVFENIEFDLRELIESAAEMLAARAQSKGVELACWIDENVPTLLRGDPGRIRQIIANLLSNGVKFTARGEVIIRVTLASETPAQTRLSFSVTDTGIGISQKALPIIFQAFTQADGSTTRKYGGTGLGLAISQQMVQLMHGQIGVESTLGTGSTFWFTLPLEKQPDGVQRARREPGDLLNLRALIVDDNATNRQILHHQLTRWKMRATDAAGGHEALDLMRMEAASDDPFSLVVLDMQMPEMDGLTLARAIKGDARLARARLLMLTSLGHRLDAAEMQAAGISACLVKPVKESRLFDALVTVAGAGFVEPLPEANLPEASAHAAAGHTPHPVRILLAEDNAVNQNLALRQLKKLGYTARAATNGLEVLAALEHENFDIILMDCQMPEMDGYEVTRRVRQQEGAAKKSPAYIIALTANALEGDRERCLAAGMNDYITKPVHLPDLKAALLLGTRQLQSVSAAAPSATAVLDPAVIAGLMELREPGQPDPVAELVELFLRDSRPRLEKMESAIAAQDAAAVASAAHSLKGSASNLGARGLAALSAELEKNGKAGAWNEMKQLLPQIKAEFERVQDTLLALVRTSPPA